MVLLLIGNIKSGKKYYKFKLVKIIRIFKWKYREFYEETKDNLHHEEIIVYSQRWSLYASSWFNSLWFCLCSSYKILVKSIFHVISIKLKPLLTVLKSTDIVQIEISDEPIVRCSWIDMVKNFKRKKTDKTYVHIDKKEIDELSGKI